jgi:hypothetical protein
MIKIEKSRIYQFTNAMHLKFLSAIVTLIAKFDVHVSKLGVMFDRLRAGVEKEESCYKVVQKSDISELKAESDNARDDIVAGIKNVLKSALHHFDVNVREAANRLKIVFDTYNRPKTIINQPYDVETVSINNLLTEWENKYAADLEITGLVSWVKELRERNDAFDRLTRNYSEQLSEKTLLRPKEVRHETDEIYKQIILLLNAGMIKEGEAEYETLVKELNVIILHYNNLLAQHLGRIEAEKIRQLKSEK